mgnify:FL=1
MNIDFVNRILLLLTKLKVMISVALFYEAVEAAIDNQVSGTEKE